MKSRSNSRRSAGIAAFYLPSVLHCLFHTLSYTHSSSSVPPPHLSLRPPSAWSSCDRSMVIDGLPLVQIYTSKRACMFQEEKVKAGDYIQSLSFCQREMESHYLTALFPPEHITDPLSVSLSLPPSPTYCLSSRKQNGVGTVLRAE